jgi:hypothetical protein
MSNSNPPDEPRFEALKNESARQRWALFHRAIAHAKQSNYQALEADQTGGLDCDDPDAKGSTGRPDTRLSIAR